MSDKRTCATFVVYVLNMYTICIVDYKYSMFEIIYYNPLKREKIRFEIFMFPAPPITNTKNINIYK